MNQELEVISTEANALVAQAQDIKIINPETYTSAAGFLKMLKGMQKRAGESFDPIIKKAQGAWKEACNQKNLIVDPLIAAEGKVKMKLIDYDAEQARIAREAQAKADAEARKAAEALEAKATKAEAKGQTEKAEDLRQQAAASPVPVVEKATPKVEGITYRENWEYEIINPDLIPKEYFVIDTAKVKKAVNVFKSPTAIPGVRAYRKDIISGRG